MTRVGVVMTIGLLLAACESATAPPASSPPLTQTWTLNVQNRSAEVAIVTPWAGAPETVLGCLQGAHFQAGRNGAPPLPWHVVVRRSDGRVLLNRNIPVGSPPREVIVEPEGAFMRVPGGSLSGGGPICPNGTASGARLTG